MKVSIIYYFDVWARVGWTQDFTLVLVHSHHHGYMQGIIMVCQGLNPGWPHARQEPLISASQKCIKVWNLQVKEFILILLSRSDTVI